MKTVITSIILSSLFVINATQAASSKRSTPEGKESISSRDIVTNMLKSIDKAKTLKFNLKTRERFDKSEVYNELSVKMLTEPLKMYIYNIDGANKGVELLYVEGEHDNKAFVNPGKWLPNLKLDPYGSRMRKDQHHTIFNTGFGFLSTIIKGAESRAEALAPGEFDKYCSYEEDVTWDGKPCYKIIIMDPEFHYLDYIVQEGDNVDKIARKNLICGYLIIEKNGDVNGFDDLKPGMKIKVPSSYAKKTILYIDKSTFLPVVQIMHDEVGQFERYEFYNLKVNPTIKDTEFTKDFDEYKF